MNDRTRVYNADCLPAMREFPDKYFDLAIVDPPYGIGEYGQRNEFGNRVTEKFNGKKSQVYKTFKDVIPTADYFSELKRVSKNQIIWGGNYFTNFLTPSPCWVIWDKGVDEKERLAMFEMAWTSFDRRALKFEYLWAGFKKAEQIERIHPTEKPVALYKWLLKNYAKEGDRILDSHGGSMSSVIACLEMGFQITCYEQDPDYYQAAKKRIEQYLAQQKLFDTHKEVEFIY